VSRRSSQFPAPPLRAARLGRAVALAAALAAVSAAPAAASADPPKPKLTLSPANGTPAASPQTQISVLGVAPSRITGVTVTGAASGAHPGKLRPYSGKRGASFLPATPLTQGEKVDVVVRVRGAEAVRSSFTVARLGTTPPILNIKVIQPDKLEKFVTEPGLQAPKLTVNKGGSRPGGAIFQTPLPSPIVHPGSVQTVTISPVGPGGPMISAGNGDLIWFRQLTPPNVAANLGLQKYRGKPVLTWWEGPVTAAAFGLGKGIIADTSYRTVAEVETGNGYKMDIHEFRLTPEGDALVTIYSPVLMHLEGTPEGKLSPVLDSIVQQIDVKTGLVVWEWHALGHIPLKDSYATPENSASYDAFHINSIQPLAHDQMLISARDTAAIYKIDRTTGKILWTLGGKSSTFKIAKPGRFWFQHDALLLPGNRVSMFDDEAGPPQRAPASRGLILQLDLKKKTAKLAQEFKRAPDTSAQSEGSTQILPGGNVFVGFGATGFFSEFTPSGKLVYDANLPDGDGSYRTYRLPWTATPKTKPLAAARPGADGGHATVYASWNGATTVAKWQVLAGADAGSLAPLGAAAKRTGFETAIPVTSGAAVFAVRALDAKGRVLSTSDAVPVS